MWETPKCMQLVERVNANQNVDAQYNKLFNGVELLKDYKVRLHIDKNIKLIAQSVRRIHFNLRYKVE